MIIRIVEKGKAVGFFRRVIFLGSSERENTRTLISRKQKEQNRHNEGKKKRESSKTEQQQSSEIFGKRNKEEARRGMVSAVIKIGNRQHKT
ncbi:hypothetical protein GOBAR_DD24480 [Gossypium barbadense]|nr:hypothetical protein GOBAR_DD24480 [Gossypium barbadense]